ncbi:MAG: M14 metallopeptidase family protein [Acidobacteriota bacterium]
MKKTLLVFGLWMLALSGSRAQRIVAPDKFLGSRVGSDGTLEDWSRIVEYFQGLAEASPRVLTKTLGQTTENNPFLLVTISAPENLQQLDKFRSIQEELADPRKVDGSPETLFEQGKSIVLITCGIHSTEVAATQMSMEFAWDLAVAQDPDTLKILNSVIFLFVPSLNPDGISVVNQWYRETLGTPAEGTSPPRLYHKYVGHDNNRDWYMFTQKETRLAVDEIHNRWHPQIVYDVHQMGRSGARMFVPPFIDPVDPNVDPILQAEIVDLGGALFSALIGAGKKGVVTNAIYDAYTPARAYQHYHGGVRILSEAASAKLATPITMAPSELRAGRNYDPRTPSWNFPQPWEAGKWTLRDIVDYEKIALRACLLHAARNRKEWLKNFYQVGLNALNRPRPYAFVLPPEAEQPNPEGLFDLLEVVDFGQVEINRATQPFQVAESTLVSAPLGRGGRLNFPTGSYIVLLRQPYGSFAKTMLEVQHYPELRQFPGGPLKRPYDVTAQTLGIQLGVETYQVDEPFQAELTRLDPLSVASGGVKGSGRYLLFSHSNNAFARLTNRLLKERYRVYWAPNGFRFNGKGYPVGTLLARERSPKTPLPSLLGDLPIQVERVEKRPELAWRRIRPPRIGLYQGFVPSMDEGWTRWILEDYEFSYTTLGDSDIRNRNLSKFDVIVFPDQSAESLKNGQPEPYPERYRGGLGEKGIARLRKFAQSGRTLIFLAGATQLALSEWDLGVTDITSKLKSEEFYVPGSLLRVRVHNRHPIGFGMGEEAAVMFVRSPAFEVSKGLSIVNYAGQDLLLSGWVDGEEHLQGRSGLVEVPVGKGRIILIGFRTQFRAQTRGTYKFLFNSLYYSTLR